METATDATWEEIVDQYSAESEKQGCLHPAILEEAYKHKWFKLFVPEVYGGAGKQLPEVLRLEEKLAAADGSLGWIITLCAGAAWFAGFLDPTLANEIFADAKVCFAGSGAVGGTAERTENGYLLNGHWKYASGALHATIFTANCKITNKNSSQEESENEILSFILKKEEVNILESWAYFGLVATGSHAFEATNLLVPFNRSFTINEDIKVIDEGFDYPFLQLAETTLAVNSLGMCAHFLKLAEETFLGRSGLNRFDENQIKTFQKSLQNSVDEIQQKRKSFYATFDASWDELIRREKIDGTTLLAVSKESRAIAHACWFNVQKLYPYCGLEAANKYSKINRVFRDIHTASQHALLTFKV